MHWLQTDTGVSEGCVEVSQREWGGEHSPTTGVCTQLCIIYKCSYSIRYWYKLVHQPCDMNEDMEKKFLEFLYHYQAETRYSLLG